MKFPRTSPPPRLSAKALRQLRLRRGRQGEAVAGQHGAGAQAQEEPKSG